MVSIQMVVNCLMPGWFFSSSRDITAMSPALVRCSFASGASSRPVQLTKWVLVIPSSWARLFICSTKAPSDPARCSAMAQAQSLAEDTAMDFSISRTVMVSPTFR